MLPLYNESAIVQKLIMQMSSAFKRFKADIIANCDYKYSAYFVVVVDKFCFFYVVSNLGPERICFVCDEAFLCFSDC